MNRQKMLDLAEIIRGYDRRLIVLSAGFVPVAHLVRERPAMDHHHRTTYARKPETPADYVEFESGE